MRKRRRAGGTRDCLPLAAGTAPPGPLNPCTQIADACKADGHRRTRAHACAQKSHGKEKGSLVVECELGAPRTHACAHMRIHSFALPCLALTCACACMHAIRTHRRVCDVPRARSSRGTSACERSCAARGPPPPNPPRPHPSARLRHLPRQTRTGPCALPGTQGTRRNRLSCSRETTTHPVLFVCVCVCVCLLVRWLRASERAPARAALGFNHVRTHAKNTGTCRHGKQARTQVKSKEISARPRILSSSGTLQSQQNWYRHCEQVCGAHEASRSKRRDAEQSRSKRRDAERSSQRQAQQGHKRANQRTDQRGQTQKKVKEGREGKKKKKGTVHRTGNNGQRTNERAGRRQGAYLENEDGFERETAASSCQPAATSSSS
jgi:hypothetical protein